MRRLLVSVLEPLCTLLRHAGGCKLARWSDALDQRWSTGVWEPCPPDES